MDWSDEAKARLEADISGEPFDGVYLLTRQRADIRAALGEIEQGRKARVALQEALGSHNVENPWLGICAAVALLQMGRKGAEAKLAEAERTIERLNTGLAQTISDRDILRAEVGRLRDLLTRAAEVVWRYDLERGDGQQVSQLAQEIVTALRGDGESTGMGHALPDQQCSPIEHKALRAEVERLREALGRVLTEAGLQAHKHGCANKIARPAQWDARLPCAGCQAESALQGR